jgi:hypothetical protein
MIQTQRQGFSKKMVLTNGSSARLMNASSATNTNSPSFFMREAPKAKMQA